MKPIKHILVSALLGALLLVSEADAAPQPDITAHAAVVMDVTTGQVLYSLNADERRYPASTTKMMSLIIALESNRLQDIVTASTAAATTDGSSMWLEAGEQQRLIDLLYGMMLVSGNDATVAVAEYLSGSVPEFAKGMTQKAHEIGAVNTHFTNSSGLPDPNHVSTAKDLALIAAYGYHNPLFRQIVSAKQRVMPWAGKPFARELFNENKLLWNYDGANGVKTGYTEAAGPCLVSGALRGDIQLVAVVMDSDAMWLDSRKLLDYGFSQLKSRRIVAQGDVLKKVRVIDGIQGETEVIAAQSVTIPIRNGDDPAIKIETDLPAKLAAPIQEGEKVGVAKVLFNGKEIQQIDLQAAQSDQQKSFFAILHSALVKTFSGLTSKVRAYWTDIPYV
ncbi:D-alanyl-D-alanine carboxypeptidase family protein [Azotosporobacter soli]|uniref:D-alanyl-D-alanine carboxypeptidase family protein n=1 Tax=Azotosporobacter soli TaxID=3055040 RepID=UPI0031FF28D7